jgi:hypothetical protein
LEGLEVKHVELFNGPLEHIRTVWYIFRPCGKMLVIWFIFPNFGILNQNNLATLHWPPNESEEAIKEAGD